MTTVKDILGPRIPVGFKDLNSFVGIKFGNCLIQNRLKDGGQGYSFLAWDSEVKKERVVKISRYLTLEDDSEENQNFEMEGIILARLRHPQIVDMIEQGKAYGYRYMIIDFINGPDFGKVLKLLHKKQKELNSAWHKILDPGTALAITASALEPLAYAHKVKIQLPGEGLVEGLAHRDISSSNLLLGMGHEYEGMVHIIDFGIAKTNFRQSISMNTNIIGTVRYLSPMRLMKKPENANKSVYWREFKQTQYDVHSMGCFLYELLTGESFINQEDIQKCLAAICNPDTYTLFADLQLKHFDRSIQNVLKKAIVFPGLKHSERQYKNATEMLEEVKKVYHKFAGERPVKETLKSFSECVENLNDIVKEIDNKTSKVIRYTTHVNMAQGKSRRRGRRALIAISILLAATGGILWLLWWNGRHRIQTVEVPPWAGQTVPPIAEVSPERGENPTNEIPSGKAKNRTGKRFGSMSSFSKRFAKSKDNNRESNNITSDILPSRDDKPAGQASSGNFKTLSRKRIKSVALLRKGFAQLQDLLRDGNTTKAYAKVNELLKQYNDPALLVVKAGLLRQRSPDSPRIQTLLNSADGRHSLLLSASEIESRIRVLRQRNK